ncbi:hypothetical protein DE146DRAFT_647137 [Phaeosphaeria sp. MPI-PUGE-AT-0046c]|nr:hypothetical protein DE146DRAFT_647137 [Phaeosphaeria sp. MPI-PUGE-AT-0046c]
MPICIEAHQRHSSQHFLKITDSQTAPSTKSSMAIFHLFARLPLELRMNIWAFASNEDRVVKVRRKRHPTRDYWSPSPVPAVTRACHESRKYCAYQKAFVSDGSFRYIWANFDSDSFQMLGSVMWGLVEEDHPERNEIRHIKIELATGNALYDELDYELEFFYHNYRHHICHLPKLGSCDVLVNGDLHFWGSSISEMYWGTCPRSNVRMIDAKTGEWIDMDTAGPYLDWMDNYMGIDPEEGPIYTRMDQFWDEEDEEDVATRYNAMMKMKEGLPRVDLNY